MGNRHLVRYLPALILPALLAAQSAPKFDVVSIRPVPPNAPQILRSQDATSILPGGQYVDPAIPVAWMILFAYDIPAEFQLTGLPGWAKSRAYSVAAKPGPDFPALSPRENREQVRLMLRAMLEDRFQLKLHTETREERSFQLEIAKNGPKLKEVDAPVPPAREGNVGAAIGDDYGRMIGNKSTMRGLARALEVFLHRPVADRTGLTGYYDFDIKWTAPDPAASTFGAAAVGLLISNLREQLGLRLSTATGPVTYWVVDRVETPPEN